MNNLILTTLALLMSSADLPNDKWTQDSIRTVSVDGNNATLVRYHKGQNNHLLGEHLSAVIAAEGKLLGFVRMDLDHNNQLIEKEKAKQIGDEFLAKIAPDLLENRQLMWIEPHDEKLIINGKNITLTGMKVKSRNTATGLYFWTMIDGNGKVYVFERDIEWLNFQGRRGTEKWLHDEWLQQQD